MGCRDSPSWASPTGRSRRHGSGSSRRSATPGYQVSAATGHRQPRSCRAAQRGDGVRPRDSDRDSSRGGLSRSVWTGSPFSASSRSTRRYALSPASSRWPDASPPPGSDGSSSPIENAPEAALADGIEVLGRRVAAGVRRVPARRWIAGRRRSGRVAARRDARGRPRSRPRSGPGETSTRDRGGGRPQPAHDRPTRRRQNDARPDVAVAAPRPEFGRRARGGGDLFAPRHAARAPADHAPATLSRAASQHLASGPRRRRNRARPTGRDQPRPSRSPLSRRALRILTSASRGAPPAPRGALGDSRSGSIGGLVPSRLHAHRCLQSLPVRAPRRRPRLHVRCPAAHRLFEQDQRSHQGPHRPGRLGAAPGVSRHLRRCG